MSDLAVRRSAIADVYKVGTFGASVDGGSAVMLSERRPLTIVHIAGNANDSAFAAGVKKACGCDLPADPSVTSTSGDLSILWQGPTRWIAVAPDRGPGVLEAALRDACGDEAAIIDVSQGKTVIRVSGEKARHVLMKGAPLDFHKSTFTVGTVAQTAISQCGVLISCVADDTFDLYVLRGFGQHIWEWACDAAGEYGYTVADTSA